MSTSSTSVPALLKNPQVPQVAKEWVWQRQQLAKQYQTGGAISKSLDEAALYSHQPLVVAALEQKTTQWDTKGSYASYIYFLHVYCDGQIQTLPLVGLGSTNKSLSGQSHPYKLGLGWVREGEKPDLLEITIGLIRGPEETEVKVTFAK